MSTHPPRIGDPVRITSGTCAGRIGIVTEIIDRAWADDPGPRVRVEYNFVATDDVCPLATDVVPAEDAQPPDQVIDGVAFWESLLADVYADGTGREKTVRIANICPGVVHPAYARRLAERLNAAADYAEAGVSGSGRSMPAAPAREESPCPAWSRQEQHEAHDFERPTGLDDVLLHCPGWAPAREADEHRQIGRPDGTWGCACGWEQDKPHTEHLTDVALSRERASRQDWAAHADVLQAELDTITEPHPGALPHAFADDHHFDPHTETEGNCEVCGHDRADGRHDVPVDPNPVDPGLLRRENQQRTATLDPEAHNG